MRGQIAMKPLLLGSALLTCSACIAQPMDAPTRGRDFSSVKQERLRIIDAARVCVARATNFDQLINCQQGGYHHMQSPIGGNWGGQKGVDDTIFPNKFLIDYVRVYGLNP